MKVSPDSEEDVRSRMRGGPRRGLSVRVLCAADAGKGGEEGELTGRASLYMIFFSLPVGIDKLSFSASSVKHSQCDDIDYAAAGEQQETR